MFAAVLILFSIVNDAAHWYVYSQGADYTEKIWMIGSDDVREKWKTNFGNPLLHVLGGVPIIYRRGLYEFTK